MLNSSGIPPSNKNNSNNNNANRKHTIPNKPKNIEIPIPNKLGYTNIELIPTRTPNLGYATNQNNKKTNIDIMTTSESKPPQKGGASKLHSKSRKSRKSRKFRKSRKSRKSRKQTHSK